MGAAAYQTLYHELRVKTPSQLAQAIPTAIPDTELTQLLRDLNSSETQYAKLIQELGPEHNTVKQWSSIIATVRTQIQDRVEGVLSGLAAKTAAQVANVVTLSNRVQAAKQKDAEMTEQYRPYFLAKKELETQQRIGETIMLRILQESVDADLPKSTMVTVTDPAEPSMRPVRPNIPLNIALGVLVGFSWAVSVWPSSSNTWIPVSRRLMTSSSALEAGVGSYSAEVGSSY